jgi:peptidoglycan/xylan/chitin deacetylase (PgdA/CDA1 family)
VAASIDRNTLVSFPAPVPRLGLGAWLVKKSARKSLALLSLASGSLGLRDRVAEARVRVLTYHRFGESTRDPFCVGVYDFERQMAWIASRGLAVSLADLRAFLAGKKSLPDGAVLVTIDDGCPSLLTHALPVLQCYDIPAVAFVPAGELTGQPARMDGPESPDARMSWDDLRALARAGVTIGSHAWSHRSLGRLPRDEARAEVERSRRELERRLEQSVTAFAYPFGTRADFSPVTRAILEAAGYDLAFTSQHGAVRPAFDPLTLPRVKVEGGERLWMFRLLVRGGLDAWQLADRALWRLQAAPS